MQHQLPALPLPDIAPDAGTLAGPVLLMEVDIAGPIPCVLFMNLRTGQRYRHGLLLVRLHTRPVGFVSLETDAFQIDSRELAAVIWDALAESIKAAMFEEGRAIPEKLDAFGLPAQTPPPYLQERAVIQVNAPKVSIVICTRDRPDRLTDCLKSLRRLNYPNYEVIVVDNAPTTDDTRDLIHEQFADVRYIRTPVPGLSRARNIGLGAANGEIIAFTDDDVSVDKHWLADLVRGFQAGEGIGCVTGLTLPAELETPAQVWYQEQRGAQTFTRRIFDRSNGATHDPMLPFRVSTLAAGMNMAFKAEVLRAIGGFDEALGIGTDAHAGEDHAAYYDLLHAGYRLAYEPGAIVHHEHRSSEAGLQQQLYGNAVGFTAHLTRALIRQPRLAPGMAGTALRVLAAAILPRRRRPGTPHPLELRLLELRGLLTGPFAYLQSRRKAQDL